MIPAVHLFDYVKSVSRPLTPDELKFLQAERKRLNRSPRNRIGFRHYLIALVIAVLFTYFASISTSGLTGLPSGFIALFAYAFIVFTPFEVSKQRKKVIGITARIDALLQSGSINTVPVNARRIALAKEFEDEGDCYILEYESGKLLFIWDYDEILKDEFPCHEFEVYPLAFFQLTGQILKSRSDKTIPILIDPQQKWDYMGNPGFPEHMHLLDADFDTFLSAFQK